MIHQCFLFNSFSFISLLIIFVIYSLFLSVYLFVDCSSGPVILVSILHLHTWPAHHDLWPAKCLPQQFRLHAQKGFGMGIKLERRVIACVTSSIEIRHKEDSLG